MSELTGARALAVALLLGALVAAPAAPRDSADLLNLRLSPELATWLVGAHGRMASKEERREFLGLVDDASARQFIERFWARRDPDPERPGNSVRQGAETRAAEADRRFTQGAYPGRRTDRGTILVLYGEPEKIEYEPGEFRGDPPLEVWRYPPRAPAGLDGRRPDRRYRFVERDGEVVLYVPGARPLRPQLRTPGQPVGGRR